MSFRVSALVAAAVVIELGSPALAQPQAPVRPRYSGFQNIFGGGRQFPVNPGQGFAGPNQMLVNPNGLQAPGFIYPGQTAYPQALPGAYGINPLLQPTGVASTFNNLGHWYGGNYGHWYPNGVASGRGVSGGGGGGYAGGAGYGSMTGGGLGRPGGSIAGTAIGVGATVGALRR